MPKKKRPVPFKRPTEAAPPMALALAFLVAKLAHVDDADTVWAIALALSGIPAAVTFTVELWRNRG
jgi:hypothetical protein